MENYSSGRPWGKLVKVDSNETVLLFTKECTVGRKKGRKVVVSFVFVFFGTDKDVSFSISNLCYKRLVFIPVFRTALIE